MVRVLVVFLGTILLLGPTLLNGAPFLYFDTVNYLSRPDKAIGLLAEAMGADIPSIMGPSVQGGMEQPGALSPGGGAGYLIGGRSVFYGLIAWITTALGHPGLLAILQSAATVALLSVIWGLLPREDHGRRNEAGFILMIAVLAFLTPAGFFAGLLMPDIFAPLAIVSIALLVCVWPTLDRTTRSCLAALLAFALVAHNSHLLIGLCMIATGAVLYLLVPAARRFLSPQGLGCCTGVAVAALGAVVASDIAAERLSGLDVISRPHMTAHLVDDGPGALWVARNCTEAPATAPDQLAVCAFRDRIPTDWMAFLFSEEPDRGAFQARDASPDLRRALSGQDLTFALAVLQDDPVGTARFLIGDALRQLVSVRYDDVPLAGEALRNRADLFPPGMATGDGGRIAADPAVLSALSEAAEITGAIGALALLIGWTILLRHPDRSAQHERLLWVSGAVVFGLLLNAAICGILASPYDRFQARVIFLVPIFATAIWTTLFRSFFYQRANDVPSLKRFAK